MDRADPARGRVVDVIGLGIDVGTTHTKVLALDIGSGATLALDGSDADSLVAGRTTWPSGAQAGSGSR